ncbi:AraC family transcriptional regulator [Tamilnaduibacter salinus]|uniref:AraC family transcriptional regulator n=1 Tax=Tamilnaduibacter salinus TaxID=1484056 RepID=A0A2U1CXH2_9GAMM|nr:AraC family transcriptional regulator [Tamilnaduibacter salinus]PVY76942.1 AraC family transcriptional regulator [Tamilnaduibacter salinus]
MNNVTSAEPRVAASSTLGLIHYLREQDCLDVPRVEAILGQPLASLDDPDHRIAASRHYQLWDHAEAVTGDPAIGLHAGATADTDRMGLAGHVFFNADTLGAAATQYVRLHRLINESVSLRLEQTDELAILIWTVDEPHHYSRQDMDRTLASTISRTQHFMQVPLDIARVRIAHPAPDYAGAYHELLQCPVEFGAPAMELAFDVRYLNRPLPHRNPYVYSAVLKQVNSLLSRIQSRRRFSRKVRRLIARQLASERMDADTLARQLHMSRQTLYRRLKKEGLSFHDLVEQVRQERALRYVGDDRYALGEIAFLLGFSELSAFSRAFKRWTGESPARYRERHRADTEGS